MREFEIDEPDPDQVVIQIGAAPINPSDLGMLFAQATSPPPKPRGPRTCRLSAHR